MKTDVEIYWHKLDDAAIIPTKHEDDAGFDIYTIEKDVLIPAHGQHLFKTGLQCYISPGYWLMGFDRGSTGSKGIHLHCGVVDNGYRGEIFICIKNDNDYPAYFNDTFKDNVDYGENGIFYPTTKAIAQLIPVAQPTVESREVSDAQWGKIQFMHPTEREEGKLGSTGK